MLLGEYSKGTWQRYTRIPDALDRTFLVLFCDLWKIGLVFYFPGIRERKRREEGRIGSHWDVKSQSYVRHFTFFPSKLWHEHRYSCLFISPLLFCLNLSPFFWPHLTFQGVIFWFFSLSMTLSIDIKLLEYRYISLSLFYLIWMLIK